MLKIEATRLEKAFWLNVRFSGAVLGPIVVLNCVFLLLFFEGSRTKEVALYLLAGLSASISSFRTLRRDWGPGEVTTRLMANSRTLALVPRGSRAIFIKRKDVAAAVSSGWSLRLADGSQHELRVLSIPRRRMQRLFLLPLYEAWFPDYTAGEIVAFLEGGDPPPFGRILLCFVLTTTGALLTVRMSGWPQALALLLMIVPPAVLAVWGALLIAGESRRIPAPEMLVSNAVPAREKDDVQ